MNEQFRHDILQGLTAPDKYLPSKYFYDEEGDKLFQKIMACDEYYPTRCEDEILRTKSDKIIQQVQQYSNRKFDIVELGAGDATKTIHLLESAAKYTKELTYYPIDISSHTIGYLSEKFKAERRWKTIGINSEYLDGIQVANGLSSKSKLYLMLGCNLGNMTIPEAEVFLTTINNLMRKKDTLLIGFDLQKPDSSIILNAYNDKGGITKEFNVNLLRRINKELDGTFNTDDFEHTPEYCNKSGECKSYLTSNVKHSVIVAGQTIEFEAGERIWTELSKKYTVQEVKNLANTSGFRVLKNFHDEKQWFTDSLWIKDK